MKYVPVSSDIPHLLQLRKEKHDLPDNPANEWQKFTRRKANRNQLKEALHIRQNGLCLYCEIVLGDGSAHDIGSHVDHILPKQIHPELTFDFANLVLSCFATGGETIADEHDPAPVSCGHAALKRSNTFDESLFIKPTDPNCEKYFSFELDGSVIPHPNLNTPDFEKAEHTLVVLNLNCLRLQRLREETITQLYHIISELQHDSEAVKEFLILELQDNKSFINARKQHIG